MFLFLFLLFIPLLHCHFPQDLKSPMVNPASCGRPNVARSQLCDPDSLLTKEQKDVIEGMTNGITQAQVAVVVLKKMATSFVDNFGPNKEVEAAEFFARKLHDDWGVGDKKSQNGVLILVSMLDRVVFISRGDGLLTVLDDRRIDKVIEFMRPSLRKNLALAIEKAVALIDSYLGNEILSDLKPNWTDWFYDFVSEYGLVFVIVAVSLFFVWRGRQESEEDRLRRGEQAMQRLVRDVENSADNRYNATSCPICLEEFPSNYVPGTSNPRRAVKIQCGHVFCESCMAEFLKQRENKKCPICRRNLDGPGANDQEGQHAAPAANDGNASSSSSSSYAEPHVPFVAYHNPLYREEMLFRMYRMHTLYPGVMNQQTFTRMQRAENPNELRAMADTRIVEVNNVIAKIQAERAVAAARGSMGSNQTHFGGGRSGGGRGDRF